MATSSSGMTSERLRYPEYMAASSASPGHIDNKQAKTLVAVGLGFVAAAFAGRLALHLHKPLARIIMENAKKIPTSRLSYYYAGGFEQKMNRREASLILGISPSASKSALRTAHRKIMILNHPDKGGSPYMAMKINEAKDLLESSRK
ncbi:dnaJ homolog subfamily C member 15 [Hyperolius riggenbachi]|uniref:dnaJ homolog subfamily C member 15 n=1 Tax=Hyperolius riggenbachi TaxID=752182 RepID=UPI0035A38623